jgi:transposase
MDDQLLRFARLAIATRRVVPPRPSKYANPAYHPAGLLAALLLREHLRLTYRGVEDLLRLSGRLRRLFGLRTLPDHSTLWWFGRRHLSPDVIAAVLGETVERAAARLRGPRLVALDSTGLWLSHASRHFEWRAKRERSQRGWLKWALALWTEPQMLLAQRVRPGPAGDFGDLVPLATAARAVLPFERLVADAGYDSEANHRFCREDLGVDSLIPAKKRRSVRVVATTPYRREMVRRLGGLGDEEARRSYRQRWKAETVMSVAKRRWGEALSARLDATQETQVLLRGVVYNLNRLVRLGCAA